MAAMTSGHEKCSAFITMKEQWATG